MTNSPVSDGPFGWGGLQSTLTATLQRGKTPEKSFLNMTLKNLIVTLQK